MYDEHFQSCIERVCSVLDGLGLALPLHRRPCRCVLRRAKIHSRHRSGHPTVGRQPGDRSPHGTFVCGLLHQPSVRLGCHSSKAPVPGPGSRDGYYPGTKETHVLPWHRRSSYEPDAPARGVPQSPRWRVGLVCAKDAKLSCRGNIRIDFHVGEKIPGELSRSTRQQILPNLTVPLVAKEDAILSKLLWIRLGSGKSKRDVIQMLKGKEDINRTHFREQALKLGLAKELHAIEEAVASGRHPEDPDIIS